MFSLADVLDIVVVILCREWYFILLLLLKAVDSPISPQHKIIKRVKSFAIFSSSALPKQRSQRAVRPSFCCHLYQNGKNRSDLVNASLISNEDGDGNENGKKNNRFDQQNNNFARDSRIFVHFFAVVSRLQRETA